MRFSKNSMSSARSSSTARNKCLSKASARAAFSFKSAKAVSGSIIQNSARCLLVFEFSARKVGPNVYTLVSARQ